ncbi:hypothetical protein FACS1894132_05890 [Clostridia bacterium]|nr:hypothetical protein FACS1894132_05890 [Clostridia bacterium]
MFQTTFKRIFAFSLSLVLLLSIVPFSVLAEDEIPQERYTVLVLDTSASVDWKYSGFFGFGSYTHTVDSPIDKTQEAAKVFCQQTGKTSQLAIISYDGEARVSADFTTNLDVQQNAIDALTTPENTEDVNANTAGNIVDALALADTLLGNVPSTAIQNIVVFTSGYSSYYTETDGTRTHFIRDGHYDTDADGGWHFFGNGYRTSPISKCCL